ncbi:Vacuolar protein sorting-associated protein 33B [Merluccius polli]|uniref:Vacuolar protein sorting-associated protein 33B n=1 Tax=Merluccius polli TaxID=89951 RepID=A0AA47NC78_MERPO|nr:Vacuolar protein sorting-associated protein 33B [Merluccius polli]
MANSRRDSPELPDFSLLKRLARDQLIYLLEQLPGRKDLFIEADLMSPLDRIANVSTLKEGNQRWVRTVGSALHLLHSLYGPFSKVYGIGRCSKMAYESWREQVEEGEQKARNGEIGSVFLIDRDVDYVTPMCSQVVYEGLVDDIFRIKCALLEGFDIRECISSIEEHINRQSYGVDHLLTFANLKQLGVLVEQQTGETLTVMESKVGKLVNDKTGGKLTDAFSSLAKKSHFRALSRRLNLVPKSDEDYDLRVPKDMAYIFSGAYIPLSCKLVEQVLERDGWTGLEEVTRLLNGHEFAASGSSEADVKARSESQRTILVMFLGGCTFSEISALRFLGKEKGYKFIIVTTAITNSARLIEALLDNHV